MKVADALRMRKSTRAFLDKAVSVEKIQRILNVARFAPSGVNIQPWQVAVVTGNKKRQIAESLENAFRSSIKGKMDYQYYPQEWKEPYKGRRKACGLQLYTTLEITRQDKEKQINQWAANYRAFDAPVMLFFFMVPTMTTGSFLDYGMFLQSLMLAAVEEGLAVCPQAALAEYPKIVKEILAYPDESILICGMALGYEDTEARVNSYRTPREEVDTFTQFFE
ncbi:MAG: nitroreductase [Pseudomonadota bacterium]